MKKGEIPWIYNEAFDPHYFSHLVQENTETATKEEDLAIEAASSFSLDYEIF